MLAEKIWCGSRGKNEKREYPGGKMRDPVGFYRSSSSDEQFRTHLEKIVHTTD